MVESLDGWSHLALDHLPVAIIAIDREGRIRIFNRLLAKLTGIKGDHILGKSFLKLLNGQNPGFNKLLQTLATGKEFQNLKPEFVIPVNTSTDFLANIYAIKNKSGLTAGAMAIFTPERRLQELESTIVKVEKLAILGQLATEMIHEIRNPLTAVSGYLQLLQQHSEGSPKKEYLDIMSAELKRINKLVSDFLQLARPGYCKRAQCSINQLITEVVALVEGEAVIRKLAINLETSEDMPIVNADSGQLKQVFLNITRNAFEALPAGGELSLRVSKDRQQDIVRVVIRDTGKGMDKQTLANMFNPFFTTKDSGAGLGMFISKKIIDNHGGHIEIQSEPARGTTVTVLLPVA
ncbi:two-component system sensor histidine kinase NtrB [Pelotomaculum propionicicum]|uniref:histidine kinase n=1 Tax=Pelotomaculum propionicicum TaxID=258475 RepID=A0A4Y7RPM8_9FIRM|nr:ATP-binding protein [Pelotomaculum propionicicum]NLI14276.1 PAS domain-containing protein [Peptococcaceae bacterium]TEB10974.1 Sporulation kinase D [Pelotomaculum propionicicum]